MSVLVRRGRVGGIDAVWREAAWDGAPTLYVHGVPDDSAMWEPFLRLTGGIAPDLPGFGESAKPAGYPYDIDGLADHLEALLDHLRVDQFSLVVHDWGTVGRALARRHPKRVERLVILDAVPLLPGYRWHWPARAWRTPGLGELAMLFTRKPTLRLFSREAAATPGPMPAHWVDRVWSHFDGRTKRAILRLYRNSPPDVLASAGARLGELTAPALVIWGNRDPYIPAKFADAWRCPTRRSSTCPTPRTGAGSTARTSWTGWPTSSARTDARCLSRSSQSTRGSRLRAARRHGS